MFIKVSLRVTIKASTSGLAGLYRLLDGFRA